MIVATLALLLAVQQAQAPLRDADPRPMPVLDPLGPPGRRALPPSTPEARQEIAHVGACIANVSTEKATATLKQDFRMASYRNALRALSDNNNSCFKRRGRMRASNLLVAGAIAEGLLARGSGALGRRLAMAAARSPVATFAPSDAAAVCVVRSDPDNVAKLFASTPASPDEAKVLTPLRALLGRCASRPVEGSDEGLRAMLATAAFRSVAADGKTG